MSIAARLCARRYGLGWLETAAFLGGAAGAVLGAFLVRWRRAYVAVTRQPDQRDLALERNLEALAGAAGLGFGLYRLRHAIAQQWRLGLGVKGRGRAPRAAAV